MVAVVVVFTCGTIVVLSAATVVAMSSTTIASSTTFDTSAFAGVVAASSVDAATAAVGTVATSVSAPIFVSVVVVDIVIVVVQIDVGIIVISIFTPAAAAMMVFLIQLFVIWGVLVCELDTHLLHRLHHGCHEGCHIFHCLSLQWYQLLDWSHHWCYIGRFWRVVIFCCTELVNNLVYDQVGQLVSHFVH